MNELYLNLRTICKLQNTTRYRDYDEAFHESMTDHSFKLMVLVESLYEALNLDLDYRRCLKMAMYHGLDKLGKVSDVDPFHTPVVIGCKMYECEIYIRDLNGIYDLYHEYEAQETEEAKFVRALDRIEAMLHIINCPDGEIINKRFTTNHADKEVEAFPKLKPFYRLIKADLRKRFEELGYEWKSEYDEIFRENENVQV